MRRIGLALGSGGARGFSEIGVLQWFEEQGIKVHCISGTSVGSIIGAAVAAGYSPARLKEMALGITWKEKVKFLRPSVKGRSVFEWGRIEAFLEDVFGDRTIEDLEIPFGCVAADIDTGREFVFRRGRVIEAVSASSVIPGVFPPVAVHGTHLVDGSVINPVPLDLAFELGAQRVIGVNACRSVFSERIMYESEHPSTVKKVDAFLRTIIDKTPLGRLGIVDSDTVSEKLDELRRSRNIIDVITDSIAIISSRMLSLESLNAGPHFIVRPPVGAYQDLDFEHAERIIELGYREAQEVGDDILEFIGS
jgi:NTE family protein